MKLVILSCGSVTLPAVIEQLNEFGLDYFDELTHVRGRHGSVQHLDTRAYPGEFSDLFVMIKDADSVDRLFARLEQVKKGLKNPEELAAFVLPVERVL